MSNGFSIIHYIARPHTKIRSTSVLSLACMITLNVLWSC